MEDLPENLNMLSRPVLIRGGISENMMTEREAFLKRYGDLNVVVADINHRAQRGLGIAGHDMSISQWFTSLARGGKDPYIFSGASELIQRMAQDGSFEVPEKLMKFTYQTFVAIGGSLDGTFPSHSHGISWSALASGVKLWLLHPPNGVKFGTSLMDVPGSLRCWQYATDVVVVPAGWWHATYNKSPWTVAFGGQGEWGAGALGVAARLGRDQDLQALTPRDLAGDLLAMAARGGHASTVKLLLEAKADPNKPMVSVEKKKVVPLYMGCQASDNVVPVLVKYGADARYQARLQPDLLHNCAAFGQHQSIKALLDAGMPISDVIAGSKSTALMHAASFGHTAAIAALLERRADTRPKDSKGNDALFFAKMMNNHKIMRMLEKHNR